MRWPVAGVLARASGGPGKKLIAAVEALYWKAPTAEQLAGTGLKAKHYKRPTAVVWPEAWPAMELFRNHLSSQWRCGPGGPLGLDHSVVFYHLDRAGLYGEARDDFMAYLDAIEAAALAKITEK
ncbi:hypothetical protein EA658_09755 [Pseudoxanthomonas winnipegensis]|uniref:Uncharacterized protein n=1 Tax=Pseudoxanthomonas winnipegensis TaxID=2480810 RepID=A0ABY1WCQ7_9GAMM|nr:hypothetical protein EA659_03895 [Pseudoxanthomonas winnipegensis]TAA19155.1 hypothetical protein EA658_09755 [Pseudoxanthomonas winnipegensis]TAH70416.1 hypothetical protein EA657_16820 [Pseudoxanthomonas winnipegensis]